MRPYILLESNWKYIKEQKFELAILPWGATEAHNYHLPYGTDVIEADFIAAESARKAYEEGAKVIVLPTIPFGVNTGQDDVLLDINLNPSTQQAIIEDIVQVLDRQGIKKLLILNSHGGNNFKSILREVGLKYQNMFISFCNWFQAMDKKAYFDEYDGDHADEMETSLMLHFTPELVRPLDEAGEGASKKWKVSGLNESWAWAERKWTEVSEDTGIGNPKLATQEKGERFFNDVTDKVSRLMADLASMDMKNKYE
ncbi:creatininase family protein [Portibacter lacus]|uniref:Amidase n=1 Tax=Portibacter lacus TaxID=1099794 RepID=A0AA37WFX2_9BACT|nr:creatininase family protein [Portibacter lacus]GLR18044.1 amidase [Portibacter lacus]